MQTANHKQVKRNQILPSALVLIAAGILLGIQRWSIATVKSDNLRLRQQLAAASKSTVPNNNHKDKPRPNWKYLATELADMQHGGGMVDRPLITRMQQCVQAMTQDELLTALDEVAALGLPATARSMLESALLGQYAQRDPMQALTRFIGRLRDDQGVMNVHLASAFQQWAKNDATKASAWFDQQIAAGHFYSTTLEDNSPNRLKFEGTLVSVLLFSDPAAAASRLAALPPNQRAVVIHHGSFSALQESDQTAYAKLVRELIPADEQARLLSQQASQLAQGGYAPVARYLDRIDATPDERTACVEGAAGNLIRSSNGQKITRENFDALRAWLGTQAPDSTERVTGRVLSDMSFGKGNQGFNDAGALAVQYSQASGTDEVLACFLDGGPARDHKEAARVLAEKIADENRRAAILKNLE